MYNIRLVIEILFYLEVKKWHKISAYVTLTKKRPKWPEIFEWGKQEVLTGLKIYKH